MFNVLQPSDYSEMLSRIFLASWVSGTASAKVLAVSSPTIDEFLKSSAMTIEIGGVTMPFLYIVIPFGVALLARIVRLHDQVSTLIGLRRYIDVKKILKPLAEGVGLTIDDAGAKLIADNRHRLMKNAFYRYAPNVEDAVINKQYVAAALDRWGWFWCCVESATILFAAAIIGFAASAPLGSTACIIIAALLTVLAAALWTGCISAAQHEIDDILEDDDRRAQILGAFNAVLG